MYDNFNVFLDFNNDEDYNLVWFRRVIDIEGLQMWFQKWTPDFKPEEDLPIVPVWVLLPRLPYHMHSWSYIQQIASTIGTPLELDATTKARTRPSMAKVRVEVDLLRSLPTSIWVGREDEVSAMKGFEQKIEYEGVLKYCSHCRKLGHSMINCRIIERRRWAETRQEEGERDKMRQERKHFETEKSREDEEGLEEGEIREVNNCQNQETNEDLEVAVEQGHKEEQAEEKDHHPSTNVGVETTKKKRKKKVQRTPKKKE